MQQEFMQGTPIYMQILQSVRQKIASGEWPPGMRVPPVRELSVALGVNPNTAQRSLAELEREQLVHVERTSGRFITGDVERIQQLRAQMAAEYAALYSAQMAALGYSADEMARYLRQPQAEEGNP